MKKQGKTPAYVREGLPEEEPARRLEYMRRYRLYWRSLNPTYSKDYHRKVTRRLASAAR